MVGKIYAWILVDRIYRMTDDELGGLRAGRWIKDQTFTLKQISEKG